MKEQGLTTITLKKINKEKVYQYIYKKRQTSKQQIVQELNMGLSTVSQNLNALEQEGLINRNGYFESTGGRKAQVIQIVSDFRIAIGVGILKNMFHIVAVDLYGEAVAKEIVSTDYSDTDEYYTKVASDIEKFIENNHYHKEQISGVSIATQGIISPDGESVTYGKIMDNSDMRLSDFSDKLPYPCRLEHDSKAAADLELWNHPEIDSAVVFLLNRNLGGAIITNRSVHQGVGMHSGSLEHMCINHDGPMCYCGNRGCLETYCSANSLEAAAGIPIKEFFPEMREKNNNIFKQIWEDYLKHLAYAIKNLNMVIDGPIIISGYLAPYFINEDIDFMCENINAATPFPMSKENIIVGMHGQFTPAIGAALYYVNRFIS